MPFHLSDLAEALVRATGLVAAVLLIVTMVLGEVELLGRHRRAHLNPSRSHRRRVVYVSLALTTLSATLLVLDIL
ncbi:hypothetical protein [Georgenia ruanii]|uniref:hypothetical protein n=1 Tax=Georgenia ruanii TaxID=348442 RepID=UPI0012653288|nr:hypothetical protein [Georgenia ruanii]